ncbi:mitogen-activated protein kinase kinase kinase 1-like [Corvus moneduloides]|uniref:mitogen-activated protein kinase kinase kinase 1-like n=1 Tax=Corvus moneduloides TaxID=1196302 RepID=UPI0013638E32|nr:mitogen-activated protein kinase kinase kinase 1-like [Corvus moneduloides]
MATSRDVSQGGRANFCGRLWESTAPSSGCLDAWEAPGQGAEPAPTLPSWRSLQLAEDRSRVTEHLRRALPYLYSPQEPLREAAVRGPFPPCHSSAPAPAAAPAAGSGPGAVEPRLPSGVRMRQGPGLSPAGGRRATGLAALLGGTCAAGAVTGSVFPGIAGRRLRGQQEELELIYKALEDAAEDISLAIGSLEQEMLHLLRPVERALISIFWNLRNQLLGAWKTQPQLRGRGWLCCWRSAES